MNLLEEQKIPQQVVIAYKVLRKVGGKYYSQFGKQRIWLTKDNIPKSVTRETHFYYDFKVKDYVYFWCYGTMNSSRLWLEGCNDIILRKTDWGYKPPQRNELGTCPQFVIAKVLILTKMTAIFDSGNGYLANKLRILEVYDSQKRIYNSKIKTFRS